MITVVKKDELETTKHDRSRKQRIEVKAKKNGRNKKAAAQAKSEKTVAEAIRSRWRVLRNRGEERCGDAKISR